MSVVGRNQQTVAGFDPVSLGGCALWLDAADTTTMTFSGSNVTTWRDKSGNGHAFSNYTGTTRISNTVQYGNPAVYFDGSSGLTNASFSFPNTSNTIFAVAYQEAQGGLANYRRLLNGGGATANLYFFLGALTSNYATFVGNGTTWNDTASNSPATNIFRQWSLLEMTTSGSNLVPYVNGTALTTKTTGTTGAFSGLSVGGISSGDAQQAWVGYCAEVLIYNSVLTSSQRQAVEGYLAWKWNLPMSPLDVPGCALWLDAADTTSMTLSGSNVTQWRDKSGSNTHASTASAFPTYASNQQNGLPALQFSSNWLQANYTFATQTTLFIVYAQTRTTGTSRVIDVNGNGYGNFGSPWEDSGTGGSVNTDALIWLGGSNYPAQSVYTTLAPQLGWRIYSVVYNGTSTLLFRNGASQTTVGSGFAGPATGTQIAIGASVNSATSSPFVGSIGEILMYKAILTTDQRQQIETYLARKWGLTLPYSARYPRLPTTHPYRLTLPTYRDFSPLDVDGLSLWLDAADQNSLTVVGSNVSQWDDKSGNGRNATQSTGSNQPVYTPNAQNGLGSITFSNPSENTTFMNLPAFVLSSNNQLSVFVVVRCSSLLVNGGGLIGDINDYTVFTTTVVVAGYYLFIYSGPGIITGFNVANATNLLGGTYNGTTATAYANGTSVGTQNNSGTGLTTSRTLRIAGGITGTVSEILLYNTALSTTQRQQVEAYLARKWGLQSTVLARTTHPYRYAPAAMLPTQIPGCALWLDAADTTSMTLSGSNVTQWRDKSGNGNNATSVGNNAATLSNQSVVFTGTAGSSSTRLTIPDTPSLRLTSPFTIYLVYSATALSGNVGNDYGSMILLSKFTDGGTYAGWNYRARAYSSSNTIYTAAFFNSGGNGQGDVIVTSSNVVDGTRKLVGLNQRESNVMYTFVNGATDLSIGLLTPLSATDVLTIGGRGATNPFVGPFNGSVNEIIIHNGSLSRAQCQQLEGYLAWKWGLQSNFPTSNHPFLLYKPVTTAFTPLQLSGLSLWLDAADVNGNGTSLSNGATVSSWVDKSGQGRTMTATTAGTGSVTYSTYGGVGSVLFNSTSSNTAYMRVLSAVNLTNFTVFIIARSQTSVGNQPGLIGIPSASARASYDSIDGFGHYIDSGIGGGDPKDRFFGSGTANAVSNAATPGTDPYPLRLGVWTNSSTGALNSWINGTVGSSNLSGSNRTSSASGFGLGFETAQGSSTPINLRCVSQFSEILVYTSVLSATDRQRIEGYLAAKWGLRPSFSPSTNHPYRFGPWAGSPLEFVSSNCALWLDAADSNTFTLSGSNVTQWRDKSGNGLVGTAQGSPVRTTVDGLSAVTFNGSTQYFDFGNVASLGSNALNIFAVSRFNTTGDGTIISRSLLGDARFRYALLRTGGTLIPLISGRVDVCANNAGVADTNTTTRLLSWTWDRSTISLLQNGTSVFSTGFVDASGFTSTYNLLVGAYNNGTGGVPPASGVYLNGSINEIVAIFGSLSTVQRQQVEGYLAWKWGLQSTLPSPSHPYSSAAWPGNPLQISSCSLWLDAADTTTLTLSGSSVTAWRDKSGNGNNPTFGVNTPTYVNGYVQTANRNQQFTVSSNVLALTNGSSGSLFFVFADPQTGGTNYTALYGTEGQFWQSLRRPDGLNYAGMGVNSHPAAFVTAMNTTNTLVYAMSYTNGSTSGSIRVNGTTLVTTFGTTAVTPTGNLTISGTSWGDTANVRLYEIIAFKSQLTTTQVQQLEGYLAWKWGLQGNLTTGATAHPYKSFRP